MKNSWVRNRIFDVTLSVFDGALEKGEHIHLDDAMELCRPHIEPLARRRTGNPKWELRRDFFLATLNTIGRRGDALIAICGDDVWLIEKAVKIERKFEKPQLRKKKRRS